MERICPSNLVGVYEYVALVVRCDGILYAEFPDIQCSRGQGTTMEELKRDLKVRL